MEGPIAFYNRMIADDPSAARTQYAQLCAEMESHNVLYDGQMMPTLLRPYLINEAQDQILRQASESVMRIVHKAGRALFDGHPGWVYEFLGFTDVERRLLQIDPGYATEIVFTRLDGFLNGRDLKFVEFNHDSPGGIGYSDQMGKIFQALPFMQRLHECYPVRAGTIRPVLLKGLLHAYQTFGLAGNPSVAIVDWSTVKTRPDFEIIQSFFRAHGLSVIIADPRELELRNGRLYCKDFAVDLVYRRVLMIELMQKIDEVADFLKAYETRAACFVNSFRCRLTENKVFFQFLTDPAYEYLFTAEERAVLRQYIPWTRRVAAGFTDFHGERIDLCDYLVRHREQFVLKPNADYGGRGVYVGSATDGAAWEDALRTALEGHWVAQERVNIPTESYPVLDGDTMTFCDMNVNIGPYYIHGQYCGSIARTSLSAVINVNAGGGSVPTFVTQV